MDKRQLLEDMGYPEAIVFDNPEYDDAIVGITDEGRVIYSYQKMCECYMAQNNYNCEYFDAVEFIDYNTLRALAYNSNPLKPIIMYEVEE